MHPPSSIYRLQFSDHFTLTQAIDLLPYLEDLGIDGIYCSPLFEAGSASGYDILNPNKINPQVGTYQDFERFVEELKKRGSTFLSISYPIIWASSIKGINGGGTYWSLGQNLFMQNFLMSIGIRKNKS